MTEHIIQGDDDAIRLDRWFKRHIPELPHAMLEKNLRKGLIRLDGKKAKSSDRIQAGQTLSIRDEVLNVGEEKKAFTPKPKTYVLTPEDAKMVQDMVLYKDANIIIVNKPYGLPVQGGSKISKSLDDMLPALAFEGEKPKLTHRLDRDTSGVLVLARSAKSANSLMHLFSGRQVEKTYWALVTNLPDPLHGTIDLPLLKKEHPKASGGGGKEYEVVQIDEEEGQKAITDYRVLDHLARKFAFVELMPLTGRMHQLRVHMQAIGCPIVGDHKYGGSIHDPKHTPSGVRNATSGSGLATLGVHDILHLHARRIVIPSGPGGKKIDVSAPMPEHMLQSFEAMGLDIPKK